MLQINFIKTKCNCSFQVIALPKTILNIKTVLFYFKLKFSLKFTF